jgi:hypothetical protein
MLLPWDYIGLCAQAQEFLLHENPIQRKWAMMVDVPPNFLRDPKVGPKMESLKINKNQVVLPSSQHF